MGWPREGLFYPPLGDLTTLFMLVTLAAIFVVALLAFWIFRGSQTWFQKIAIVVGVISLFLAMFIYSGCYERYVRVVWIPRLNAAVAISVGDERTPYAKELGNISDYDLLSHRGVNEEEVKKLWTPRSLAKAHNSLWVWYTFIAMSIVFIVSMFVTQHAHEKAAESRRRHLGKNDKSGPIET